MEGLKKVTYKAMYNGLSFDILTWKGTPLNVIWNFYKGYYLPGSVVTLINDEGHSEKFLRGMC